MPKTHKSALQQQINLNAREYGISTVLFRHAVAERLGINVTDMECLALVLFKGLATPSELSRFAGLTSGATTAMLDRLERARLIERQPNPQDRRGTLIVLTNERIRELSGLFAPARKAVDELNASYGEAELELISGYLGRLAAIWDEERRKLPAPNVSKV
jgi:DNA-binding MarR family transcriptional regulator